MTNEPTNLDAEKQYDLKAKRNGKFWGFGMLKVNQWGNWGIGMKVTKELKELINGTAEGSYINFSVFEREQKRQTNEPSDQEIQF